MVRRRWIAHAAAFFMALAAPGVGALLSSDAAASVSVAVTWDALLRVSSAAAVVSVLDGHAVWEDGRICTYTRLHVDRSVAGELGAGSEAWVRTLGGVVGKIGQIVEGEAVFAPHASSLLFLRPGPAGTYVVTARAQGQFPVSADDPKSPPRIVRSTAMGMILPPRVVVPAALPRLAADVLPGRAVDDVAREIATAWGPAHAQ